MIASKKRVLWLLNHSTLRDFEVPLLVKLGKEVFIPKEFPRDESNLSASVTYTYDATLSIPSDLLRKMNEFDFYSRDWPAALQDEINANFDIAICAFFPGMINAVCKAFEGDIFLRAFGREGNLTYASILEGFCDKNVIGRIKRRDRIWFASAYSNIAQNEPGWLRRIDVTLPIGLPKMYYETQNQWRGGCNQILFVCPRIKSSRYYNQIYMEFKTHFGDLPHLIAGVQPEAVVEDPNVTGFVEHQRYQELKNTCAVMFYGSREQRHLHYHPLEAIISGMPLIYMTGGMLHYLTRSKLPGCCDTLDEARQKIIRILNRDKALIETIIKTQKVLANEFSNENVELAWETRFLPLTQPNVRLSTKISNRISDIFGSSKRKHK
jgi:hypothetical protein